MGKLEIAECLLDLKRLGGLQNAFYMQKNMPSARGLKIQIIRAEKKRMMEQQKK
jgi:hypothetical protein